MHRNVHCTSTVLECSCCRIHFYVAAPLNNLQNTKSTCPMLIFNALCWPLSLIPAAPGPGAEGFTPKGFEKSNYLKNRTKSSLVSSMPRNFCTALPMEEEQVEKQRIVCFRKTHSGYQISYFILNWTGEGGRGGEGIP
jgi:hypothetical protein